jgi:hypothetical protein
MEIDGWRCEDFSARTGHVIGRSAQRGDLQIYVTLGEREAVQEPSVEVQRWLMTGELPPPPPEPDKRQVPFPFVDQERA